MHAQSPLLAQLETTSKLSRRVAAAHSTHLLPLAPFFFFALLARAYIYLEGAERRNSSLYGTTPPPRKAPPADFARPGPVITEIYI